MLDSSGNHSLIGSIPVQLSTGEFLKANVKQNGFYRVNYDSSNWQAIIDHLRSSSFSDVSVGVKT